MTEIGEHRIKEIAEELEMGLVCYIHKESLELITIPGRDNYPDLDDEVWEESIEKVENDEENYICIEPMKSSESFRIMEDFIESIDSRALQYKLINALEGRKPFANFKFTIDNSGKYREQWFAFRTQKYFEWVRDKVS